MAAAWTSNLPEFERRLSQATDRALVASAQVLVNAVKRALRGGYTSGEYVTGASVNAVTRSEPVDENGVRVVRVGTPLRYNLFWEVGHHRRDGSFVRVEKWRPAAEESAPEMQRTFARVLMREMGVAT